MNMKLNQTKPGWHVIKLIFLCVMMFSVSVLSAKEKPEESPLRNYTIENAGRPAGQGSYMVKVTVTTKDKKLSDQEIGKCAVHGVLFKGFSGANYHTEKPLAKSASVEAEHQEYFDSFFSSTRPSTYVNALPSTRQVTKSGKYYVISEVVEVQKDLLRKDLQQAGILRSLNSGF